jgi:inorganic triphosphatase YgiF
VTPGSGGGAGDRTEVESTLLVAPERGEELAAEVASLGELAGHRVRRRDPVVLTDAYFDTPDDALGRAGFALRLRRAGGEVLVAVKGDERRLPDGGTRRLELERRWSHGALAEIGELLAARGVQPPSGDWPGAGRRAARRRAAGRGRARRR